MDANVIDVSRKKKNYKIGIIICSSFAVLSLAYLIWDLIYRSQFHGREPFTVLLGNPYVLLSTLFEIISYGNLYTLLILLVARFTLTPPPDPTLSRWTYRKGIIISSFFIGIYLLYLLIITPIICSEGYNLGSSIEHSFMVHLFYSFDIRYTGNSFYSFIFTIVNYILLGLSGISSILLPVFLVLRSGRYQQWKRGFQQRRIARQEQKEQQVTTTAIVQEPIQSSPPEPKSRLTAFLLCFFLGDFGAHRFYVGRTKSAVLWLLTFGLFNVGSFVDLIMILTGNFRDAQGNLLIEWDPHPSKPSVAPSSLSSLS